MAIPSGVSSLNSGPGKTGASFFAGARHVPSAGCGDNCADRRRMTDRTACVLCVPGAPFRSDQRSKHLRLRRTFERKPPTILRVGSPDIARVATSAPARSFSVTIKFPSARAASPRRGTFRRVCGLISVFIGGATMNIGTVLLVLLVLILVGALPTWSHSANWGYFPSGASGILLIIVVVLLVSGRL